MHHSGGDSSRHCEKFLEVINTTVLRGSDVNKNLGPKAKDLDPKVKAKDLGRKAKVKDLIAKAKAKDLRCQGQISHLSFYTVF